MSRMLILYRYNFSGVQLDHVAPAFPIQKATYEHVSSWYLRVPYPYQKYQCIFLSLIPSILLDVLSDSCPSRTQTAPIRRR
jgi:hypothetical protein